MCITDSSVTIKPTQLRADTLTPEEKLPQDACLSHTQASELSGLVFLSAVSCMVLFPNHYNRFQMVLENSIDSEHQKKSVIL